MADAPKKHEEKTHAPVKPEGKDKQTEAVHKPAAKKEPDVEIRKDSKKADHKPEVHREQKEAGGKAEKKTGAEKKSAEAARRAQGKTSQPTAKKGEQEDVKIVDTPTPKKHVARAKATLSADQVKGLAQRAVIAGRRPWFRRQQWYEYKRLSRSGWRKPTGMDSAMRRHFGYEQSVVRVGFGGPKSVRGLHPSGFREVYVDQIEQLKAIDTKTQAARINGNIGTRKLKLIYAEADKLGVRILNRRNLE